MKQTLSILRVVGPIRTISFSLVCTLYISGCQVLDPLINPSPPTQVPVSAAAAAVVQRLPDLDDERTSIELRLQAIERLDTLPVDSVFRTSLRDRFLSDSSFFVDDFRFEDRTVLDHDRDLVNQLINQLGRGDLDDLLQSTYLEVLELIVLADIHAVRTLDGDAEVIARSVQTGEENEDAPLGLAQSKRGAELSRETLSKALDALRRGEVRGGLGLLGEAWELAKGVRSVLGIEYDGDNDEDGLVDLLELQLGASPMVLDSDGDGLSDFYEVEVTELRLSPGDADTDKNGIPDGDEDLDKDGLPTLMEYDLGTNPLMLDTDGDGISDLAVVLGETMGEQTGDSDGDGISDESEERLGLDPLNVDTDGDGLPDSQEWHRQVLTFDDLGVMVEIEGLGDHSQTLTAERMIGAPGFAGQIGAVGDFIHFTTTLPYREAWIQMPYDESLVPVSDEENLRLFRYDDTVGTMVILQFMQIDYEANLIAGETDTLGSIGVLYLPIWRAINPG